MTSANSDVTGADATSTGAASTDATTVDVTNPDVTTVDAATPGGTRAGVAKVGVWRRGFVVPVAAVCLALLAPVALVGVVLWLLGWRMQPVQSSSMAPLYPEGALLFVSPIDAAEVQPGMVIVFLDPVDRSRMVAHRVVSQVPGDVPAFRTRGDANLTDDPYPVYPDAIRGRVRWGVAGLGTVISALTSGWGSVLLIGAPAGTLIGTELYDYYRRRRTTKPTTSESATTEPAPGYPDRAVADA